jgi:uncharacterized protein (DUF2236 family)
MMWKVNRESVLLLGGRGALLMQLAHPLVAAGVSDHSDFQTDPFKRLRRTLDVMLSITFGDLDTATEMMRRVEAVHSHVKGTADDGAPYSAADPELAKWVYATLVYSSVSVYQACVAPLTEAEAAVHYEESKVIARMFGVDVDRLPATRAELFRWMSEMIDTGEVRVTPLAKSLAEPILRPIRIVPRRVATGMALVTAALLPPALRSGYGLRSGLPESLLLGIGRRTARAVIPRLPQSMRVLPAAQSALQATA